MDIQNNKTDKLSSDCSKLKDDDLKANGGANPKIMLLYGLQPERVKVKIRSKKLEEENKKLKEEIEKLEKELEKQKSQPGIEPIQP